MQHRMPSSCPVCSNSLSVTGLKCSECGTQIRGDFTGCRFCSLNSEQTRFLLTFLQCRGSLKEMEKRLGISYPTIKNRLEELISALDLEEQPPQEEKKRTYTPRTAVLAALQKGEITPEQSLSLLNKLP